MTVPPSPQSADILRRLRARSVRSWEGSDRLDHMRSALDRLEALTAQAEQRPPQSIPEVEVYILADQLLVLLADAQIAGVDPAEIDAVMGNLADALSLNG